MTISVGEDYKILNLFVWVNQNEFFKKWVLARSHT